MNTTNLSIKAWAEDDRPREKMMLKGRSSLSNAELLAILIGSGNRYETAVDVAKKVLHLSQNSLDKLGHKQLEELKSINGIGDAKAITLMAALELGRRRKTETVEELKKITSSKQAYALLKPFFSDLDHEEFRVIAMNRANKVLSIDLISVGGFTSTIADGKKIFKNLLANKACACIFAHNHPSGNLKPSDPDIKMTKSMADFAKLIDINLLDHLIITNDGFYSMADNGILPG